MIDRKNEWLFWIPQLAEHAEFLALGLTHEELGRTCRHLGAMLRRAYEENRLMEEGQAIGATEGLVRDLRAINVAIYEKMGAGEWTGWLSPTFVDHMRRETDFFLARIAGEDDPRKAFDFYAQIAAEHGGLAASFVDPLERSAIATGLRIQAEVEDVLEKSAKGLDEDALSRLTTVGAHSEEFFTALGKKTEDNKPQVEGPIPPGFAAHAVRETERFNDFLAALRGES